jgi:hypothetical protein
MASASVPIDDDPAKEPKVEVETADSDLFVLVDGVRVAQRGRPGTSAADTWVTLVNGYTVSTEDIIPDRATTEILIGGRRNDIAGRTTLIQTPKK